MNQNYIIPSNYQNETFIPGNNYSVGLQQARDVIQTEQSFSNNHSNYSPNNCFFTSTENNLSTQHDNVIISDRDKQQPMSPCALPSHPPLPSQYYPQISAPKQQLIHNNVNSRQVLNQNMQFSHNDLNNSSNNSQLHYTELFKIEISGIEIVVRQKLLPRLNLEMQQQRDEQPPLNLTNRTERSHQNRMHPYNMPGNEQNYRIINRNPNIILRQQNQQHYYSMRQQKNNVSEVDRTTVNESTNNINIQNTLVNQSAVFTRQRTDSFEECNHPLNQEL